MKYVPCTHEPKIRRGCCFSCYNKLQKAVQSGLFTWQDFEDAGVCKKRMSNKERNQKFKNTERQVI